MKEKKKESIFSQINKISIISLIFSVIGIIQYGVICGSIGVITGIIALIILTKKKQKGKEEAILSIAIGITDIVMAVVWAIIKVTGNN